MPAKDAKVARNIAIMRDSIRANISRQFLHGRFHDSAFSVRNMRERLKVTGER